MRASVARIPSSSPRPRTASPKSFSCRSMVSPKPAPITTLAQRELDMVVLLHPRTASDEARSLAGGACGSGEPADRLLDHQRGRAGPGFRDRVLVAPRDHLHGRDDDLGHPG